MTKREGTGESNNDPSADSLKDELGSVKLMKDRSWAASRHVIERLEHAQQCGSSLAIQGGTNYFPQGQHYLLDKGLTASGISEP